MAKKSTGKDGKVREKIVIRDGDRMAEYAVYGSKAELVGLRRVGSRVKREEQDIRDELGGLKALDLCEFNKKAEEEFLRLLEEMLEDSDGCSVRELRAEAAYRLGVSVETSRRYIEKYTAPSAPYRLSNGILRRRRPSDK